MPAPIDINSDLGEGFGQWRMSDDEALLDIVSSANIACGFHAGDPSTMRRLCEFAAARKVTIGAHVSYPDLAGFGRRYIDIDPGELRDAVTYQLSALAGFAAAAGTYVCYVKPHGALYNTIVHDPAQAQAVIDGVLAIAELPILGLADSVALRLAADAGLRSVTEAFVDRAYNRDGTLVKRSETGALLHDVDAIAARSVRMVTDGLVTAIDGTDIPISAESICVHGDTPGSVAIATAVRHALEAAGVAIRPFMP
jgi:5-oxoprolinase (ATP-hydrolysing) subunit A